MARIATSGSDALVDNRLDAGRDTGFFPTNWDDILILLGF